MKRFVPLILFVVALISACSGAESTPTAPAGDEETHARINALTDCAALQSEFNAQMAVVEALEPGASARAARIAYAETAATRMKAVGCS